MTDCREELLTWTNIRLKELSTTEQRALENLKSILDSDDRASDIYEGNLWPYILKELLFGIIAYKKMQYDNICKRLANSDIGIETKLLLGLIVTMKDYDVGKFVSLLSCEESKEIARILLSCIRN